MTARMASCVLFVKQAVLDQETGHTHHTGICGSLYRGFSDLPIRTDHAVFLVVY